MRPPAKHYQRGLTLVEVLVAFAILAGVVVSVMALISQNTRYIIFAEERFMAEIAADNLLTEALARQSIPGEGVEEGEATFAGRTFVYTRSVADLKAGIVQIEFEMRRPEETQILARAFALKRQP